MKYPSLLALAVLALAACDAQTETTETQRTPLIRPAKIAIAREQRDTQEKTFPGVTEATRKSTLAFRVGGQVIELPVHAGQELKKGDLIARLDDTPYRNALAQAKAAHDLAKTDFERKRTLYRQKHAAKAMLDSARSAFESAAAALRLAEDNVGYTRLTAPYDGIVSRIDIDNFQNVQPQAPIVHFQGSRDVDIAISVPESLFMRLNKRKIDHGTVKVRFDSLPDRTFDAHYREHDTLPDATTRSFRVVVSMPRPEDIAVFPGMSVSVIVDMSKIFASEVASVAVPIEALFEDRGQTWVWKLDGDNAAHRTTVTAGSIEGDRIRITNGLTNGDRVIAAGVSRVREGQKVRPLVRERGI